MLNRRGFFARIAVALGGVTLARWMPEEWIVPDVVLRRPVGDEDVRMEMRDIYNRRAGGQPPAAHPRTIFLGSDAYARFKADMAQNERLTRARTPSDPPGEWLWFKAARVYSKGSGWGMTIVA